MRPLVYHAKRSMRFAGLRVEPTPGKYLLLCRAMGGVGLYGEAYDACLRAFELLPWHPISVFDLANAAINAGRMAEARVLIEAKGAGAQKEDIIACLEAVERGRASGQATVEVKVSAEVVEACEEVATR